MLPKWHILFGALFALLIWITVPSTNPLYIGLIFLSSFLINFDYYLCIIFKTKKHSLKHTFEYHRKKTIEKKKKRKKIREKGDFHFFNSIEFHILVGILGIFWRGFFYIFLGMIFHSILDIYSLLFNDRLYRREYFFVRWLWRKIHEYKIQKT